jgi:hypothetical protein
MKDIILKYSGTFFRIFSALYFVVSIAYFFFVIAVNGDEGYFIGDINRIKTDGWNVAIAHGISLPYMILVYPFTFVFENFVALRLVNALMTAGLLWYFWKMAKIRTTDFYFYLFFYIATSSFFVTGIDDILLCVALIIFITEVFYFLENKRMENPELAFCALAIAVFTRELFVVYVPLVLLSFYFLYKNGFGFFTRKMILPALVFLLLLLANLPSITAKRNISYNQKTPPSDTHVTWAQRQYLAQLLVNKGELQNFKHPSWQQAQEYLDKNGENSLPKTTFQSLTFDYKLTITEFFKDFYYSVLYGFRQMGLILFFMLFLVLESLLKRRVFADGMYIPLATTLMVCVFSFIIISYVELRWLIIVFAAAIVFYSQRQSENKINSNLILANYLVLTCFSLYGSYNLFMRLLNEF